jgi:hypothetical protein
MKHNGLRMNARWDAGIVTAVRAGDVLQAQRASARYIVRRVKRAPRHAASVVLPEDVFRWMKKLTVESGGGAMFCTAKCKQEFLFNYVNSLDGMGRINKATARKY